MTQPLRLVVVGDPIEHSLSPRIHRAALDEAQIVGEYVAIRADEGVLRSLMERMRLGGIDGINVTMPLKTVAASLCDHLTEEAFRSRSVNTIRFAGKRLEGHSTDALAMAEVLATRFDREASVLILGGGATARVAVDTSPKREVFLSARRRTQSERLARGAGRGVHLIGWGVPVAGAVVVNATPIGMGGEALPRGVVEMASGLVDLAYGDEPTPSVTEAQSRGVTVIDGLEFLALQAALSFEWWTGIRPTLELLVAAARRAVGMSQNSQAPS